MLYRQWLVLSMLFGSACCNGPDGSWGQQQNNKTIVWQLGDFVEFRYVGENVFYAKACENKGLIDDKSHFIDQARYLVYVKCKSMGGYELIWVSEKDILTPPTPR